MKKRKQDSKKILLVVDDEYEIQELINAYLSGLDVEIYSAYSGEEGVRVYKQLLQENKRPDLVVMDLNLSGSTKIDDMLKQFRGETMDGLMTTKEILKIDPIANIVGFTAYAEVKWGKMLKATGAKAVWGREIGFDGFAKNVSEILT